MLGNLTSIAANGAEVLVGPETSDDAGVYLFEGNGLVSTADFITPVCDDPARFGFVAAANSLSDVYAMGGKPLFALNLCAFPENVEHGVLKSILEGGAAALGKVGAALLGGHTVYDNELKYGLAVVGAVDPNRILTNTQARTGDRLVLTKPLGTGVMINAFKLSRIDADTLEPCLKEMERMNAEASAGALALLRALLSDAGDELLRERGMQPYKTEATRWAGTPPPGLRESLRSPSQPAQ